MAIIIISTALIIINLILWIVLFVKLKKSFSPKIFLKQISGEINELIAEMNRETDRDVSILEARRDGLKKLIDEASSVASLSQAELQKKINERYMIEHLAAVKAEPEKNRRSDNSIKNTEYDRSISDFNQKKNEDTSFSRKEAVMDKSNSANEINNTVKAVAAYQKASVKKNHVVASDGQNELFEINLAQNYQNIPVIEKSAVQIEIKKPLRIQIIDLHKKGFSPDIISEKLHIPVIEVNIAIDVFNSSC